MTERKKIPKYIKDMVWIRQKGGCVACINQGKQYHHVLPISLGGSNDSHNIVLICKEHHKLLHLGDLDTCLTILEYVYYLKHHKLPDDIDELKELAEKIKKEHLKKDYDHDFFRD